MAKLRLPYSGTGLDLAPFSGMLAVPTPLPAEGIPFGYDIKNNRMVNIDFWMLKKLKLVGALIVMVLGEINHGKTSLNKALALRMSILAMGQRQMRLWVSDSKRNDEIPEYQPLIEMGFCEREVQLGLHPFNLLDPELGMTLIETAEMLTNVFLHTTGRRPTNYEYQALMSAMEIIATYPGIPTLEKLVDILGGITLRDVKDTTGYVMPNLRRSAFSDGAAEVAMTFNRVLLGEIGNVFGGDESIAGLLSQRIVGLDFSNVDRRAVNLLQALIWQWKASAARRQDSRFKWDIFFNDENYGDWESLVYATETYRAVKQIRATGGMIVFNTHRLADYESVGEAGSPQRALATNVGKDATVWFIGNLTPEDAEYMRPRLGLTRKNAAELTMLPPGVFMLKLGKLEPRFIRLVLTDRELEICESNTATDRLLARRPVEGSELEAATS